MKKLLLSLILGLLFSSSMVCGPIHDAAYQNDETKIRFLLRGGTDANVLNNSNETPLKVAINRNCILAVSALLEGDANPNIKSGKDEDFVPLYEATCHRYISIVQDILRHDADPDITSMGSAALHAAADSGYINIVYLLLNKHANPNIQDNELNTPLHYAVKKGRTELAQLLLDNGANPNIKDNDGWTPLHWTVRKRNCKMINLLCEAGANSNALNNKGRTPFMICGVEPWQ